MGLTKVSLDTNILLYFFEDAGPRGARATQILSALSARGDFLIVSTLTLGELLVKPVKAGDQALANLYRSFAHGPEVRLLEFNEAAAELFARIRQDRQIKPPDAILLATAGSEGCDLFVTNDDRLVGKNVSGIKFIVSMERAPF
jgi:predicted nucleic acid-binding protein